MSFEKTQMLDRTPTVGGQNRVLFAPLYLPNDIYKTILIEIIRSIFSHPGQVVGQEISDAAESITCRKSDKMKEILVCLLIFFYWHSVSQLP